MGKGGRWALFLHVDYEYSVQLQQALAGQSQIKTTIHLHNYEVALIYSGHNNTLITDAESNKARLVKNEWYLQFISAEVQSFQNLFIIKLPSHGIIINNQPILRWHKNKKSFTIPRHLIIDHQDNLTLLARTITNDFEQDNLNNLGSQYNLNSLLIALSRAYVDSLTNFDPMHQTRKTSIYAIKHYIIDHMHEHLKVSQISDHFQITPEYLANIFQKSEHITVTNYINYLRISGAKNLLISTNLLVKQIAYYYGFHNTKYFFRLFKVQTGLTPSKYCDLFQNK